MLEAQGQRDEGIEWIRHALRLDPKSAPYHNNLADMLVDLGLVEEAVEHARLATRYSPRVGFMHLVLGRGLAKQGRTTEAIGEFQQAVGLDPTEMQIRSEFRSFLIRERRCDEAMTVWKDALEADQPNHVDWYGYAEFCLFLGHEEEYRRARRRLLAWIFHSQRREAERLILSSSSKDGRPNP